MSVYGVCVHVYINERAYVHVCIYTGVSMQRPEKGIKHATCHSPLETGFLTEPGTENQKPL